MALPTSGQLSYSQINVELGNGATSQASMAAMAAAATPAFPTTNRSVSMWYGYSDGSNIVVDFSNTTTYITNTTADKDGYKSVVMTGRDTGDVFTLNLTTQFTEELGAIAFGSVSYRRNGGLWSELQAYSAPGSSSESITLIDDNDTIEIRVGINGSLKGSGTSTLRATLTGGTITTGTGTVTASGLLLFLLSVTT